MTSDSTCELRDGFDGGGKLLVYHRAFDEYHVGHDLSSMEKLLAGYVDARLEEYLKILQD